MSTRIDWCDETINPLGFWCFGPNGTEADPRPCPYCYAKKLAERGLRRCPQCQRFEKHTHFEQLDKFLKWRKPRTIFVQSMGDLFHNAVPDEWIKEVFEAANRAPQHRYIYLTKNPDRYYQLGEGDGAIIPDGGVSGYFGASACTEEQAQSAWENSNCRWMSLEPIHGEFSEEFFWHDALVGDGVFDTVRRWDWIVVGAETGNRKGKVVSEKAWIDEIAAACAESKTPIFMKESLRTLMGADFVQEFPWSDERKCLEG